MNRWFVFCALIYVFLMAPQPVFSHCEIPCGIYGDEARLDMIEEDITTIEKSMNMILKLSKEGETNYNQLVRWVSNKDAHAEEIQQIVQKYFMTQRVKPAEKTDTEKYQKYLAQLTLLHEMLIYAMKAKQTTDLEHIKKLRSLVAAFRVAYFEPGK